MSAHGSLAKAACLLGLAALLAGCAEPKPLFYPNAHYNAVGQSQAQYDVDDCRRMAENAGASRGTNKAGSAATGAAAGGAIGGAAGAAGGAVLGSVGRGAAVGAASGAAAGLVRAMIKRPQPSSAYKGFVNRCLSERGYDVVGWE